MTGQLADLLSSPRIADIPFDAYMARLESWLTGYEDASRRHGSGRGGHRERGADKKRPYQSPRVLITTETASRGNPRGSALQAAVVASRQADRNRVTWMTDSRIAGPARSCQMVNQEASKMNMICRWVHADNGALVMEWTKAEDSEVHWGTGANEVAYTFEVSDHNADALTSVAV